MHKFILQSHKQPGQGTRTAGGAAAGYLEASSRVVCTVLGLPILPFVPLSARTRTHTDPTPGGQQASAQPRCSSRLSLPQSCTQCRCSSCQAEYSLEHNDRPCFALGKARRCYLKHLLALPMLLFPGPSRAPLGVSGAASVMLAARSLRKSYSLYFSRHIFLHHATVAAVTQARDVLRESTQPSHTTLESSKGTSTSKHATCCEHGLVPSATVWHCVKAGMLQARYCRRETLRGHVQVRRAQGLSPSVPHEVVRPIEQVLQKALESFRCIKERERQRIPYQPHVRAINPIVADTNEPASPATARRAETKGLGSRGQRVEHIQTRRGVESAIFPTSSSTCMIFLIRACNTTRKPMDTHVFPVLLRRTILAYIGPLNCTTQSGRPRNSDGLRRRPLDSRAPRRIRPRALGDSKQERCEARSAGASTEEGRSLHGRGGGHMNWGPSG